MSADKPREDVVQLVHDVFLRQVFGGRMGFVCPVADEAMFDVLRGNESSDLTDRRVHRRDLIENIAAVGFLRDHPADAADLAFEARQAAVDQFLLIGFHILNIPNGV